LPPADDAANWWRCWSDPSTRPRRGQGAAGTAFCALLADPDQFALISEWDSQHALDQHYRSEAFTRFQFELGGLLARPSQLTVYSVTGSLHPIGGRPTDPPDAD
jgi:hypothetical protein